MAAQNTPREGHTESNQPGGERQATGQTGQAGQTTGQTGGTKQSVPQERERPMQTSREGTAISRQTYGPSIQQWTGGVSPFSFMRRLSEDMDRLFSNFGLGTLAPFGSSMVTPFGGTTGRDLWTEPMSRGTGLVSPQVDLFRRGEELVIRCDLPGLTKEDITVDAEDNVLTIRGERKQESDEDVGGYYWNERTYGAFQRNIPLPEGVNADQAKAEFRDGVLEVVIPAPRQTQRRGKNIQIR